VRTSKQSIETDYTNEIPGKGTPPQAGDWPYAVLQ